MIYHPEYNLLEYGKPFNNSHNNDTYDIALSIMKHHVKIASLNPNRFNTTGLPTTILFSNATLIDYQINSAANYILAYGY